MKKGGLTAPLIRLPSMIFKICFVENIKLDKRLIVMPYTLCKDTCNKLVTEEIIISKDSLGI